MLQSLGSQRVGQDRRTEQQQRGEGDEEERGRRREERKEMSPNRYFLPMQPFASCGKHLP